MESHSFFCLAPNTRGSASLKPQMYMDIVLIDYPGKCYNDITSEHASIMMRLGFYLTSVSLQIIDFLSFWNGSSLSFMYENTFCPLILQAAVSSDGTVNRIVRFCLKWIE